MRRRRALHQLSMAMARRDTDLLDRLASRILTETNSGPARLREREAYLSDRCRIPMHGAFR
jgi:hypothetical protein